MWLIQFWIWWLPLQGTFQCSNHDSSQHKVKMSMFLVQKSVLVWLNLSLILAHCVFPPDHL
jgi:hypothetical protein